MKTEFIMGIPVDCISYKKVIEDAHRYIENNQKMSIISVNPQIVVESKKYPEIISFIQHSTHRIPDGIGIVMISKLTGGDIKERIAGFDMMKELLLYANNNKKSIFLYGAKPAVLTDAIKNIASIYPQIDILGGIDGYTSLSDSEIVAQINRCHPNFLFVALGFPKQEQWLAKNINNLSVNVFQDVGGSFDVLSGHVKRAPQFYIDHHLEWLYRSLSNPARIGRIFQLPFFIVKSLWWKLKGGNK
ncbi:WecB/TagA/CpsF family glycosyltransferase [Enterococcus gallinarum]|uniref:WecB/TagA/CpsF family glycosyltransferase n=1 Tax=Enterococcus TaxID=1350 RepID=UPI0015629569|nr:MULTISPECIES: WecB/TagA/CpsF family glycosyltransferase [Enterococcus]MBS5959494.1 WecB/TagA/CpsF family glycosyltransferase [Enterococcus gallinarum]MCD4986295.1 WecB/TagA/CpsF family glycosyltransferase [Enterococcus gallinarum]MCD5154263.1 WecB/TagA/CpsF family glycosyltransferase [Enterococcus gallinarum]MCI1134932.1 WecB/TagA/CpsF family glycosyltransferase [Enterococcus gallinarum]MDL4906478.1 WecB/TagA/CpsF family glycosyltransferase [Enterococcus gallinarum]